MKKSDFGELITLATPCKYCGSEAGVTAPGKGIQWGQIKCSGCNRHLRWLAKPSNQKRGQQ